MIVYKAYKHKESGCIWVPFYQLDNNDNEGLKVMVTNGVISRELTEDRKDKVDLVEITKEEFDIATKNIGLVEVPPWVKGQMSQAFGLVFTVTNMYDLSDEYMKENELVHRTRVVQNSPLYEFGAIERGVTIEKCEWYNKVKCFWKIEVN